MRFVPHLKQAIRDNCHYEVIHIVEGLGVFPKQPNDHTFKQLADEVIAVSELGPGDKLDILISN